MKICENKKCGKEHDGTYGTGRFCSKSCACARIHTKETKEIMRKKRIEYFENNPEAAIKLRNRMLGDSNPSKFLYVKQKQREAKLGNKNPMKNEVVRKKHLKSVNDPEYKENMRILMLGDKNPSKRPEERLKKSIIMKRVYNSQELRNKMRLINKGRIRSEETKRKLRLIRIEQIEKNENNGNQIHPNFNPNACLKIDEYGKQYNYNFQHAMNGGEFYIEKLGYWVDGYDREKNVVIEYYEKKHENTKERDEKRKQEIINDLGCQFIELKEGWS